MIKKLSICIEDVALINNSKNIDYATDAYYFELQDYKKALDLFTRKQFGKEYGITLTIVENVYENLEKLLENDVNFSAGNTLLLRTNEEDYSMDDIMKNLEHYVNEYYTTGRL